MFSIRRRFASRQPGGGRPHRRRIAVR